MAKQSAGILVFRRKDELPEVLLVHPGGPFFAHKDVGVWSIPKGELDKDEDPFAAALREFEEETSLPLSGSFTELAPVKQKSGKIVHAWAIECDPDLSGFASNIFSFEWPMRSGKFIDIPEVDRVEWMDIATARQKINAGQVPLLTELMAILGLAESK